MVLIQNLAIADLCYAISIIFPSISSTIAEEWLYGHYLCVFAAYAQFGFAFMNVVLISALNISKLTCLLSPLRSRNRAKRHGYVIAIALWIFSFCYIIAMAVVDEGYKTVTFDTKMYALFRCVINFKLTLSTRIYTVATLFTNMSIIIGTTAWMLYFVQKVRGLQKEAVISLVLISVVFILSYIPYGISTVIQNAHIGNMGGAYRTYFICSVFVVFLNSFTNPFIYYISINSFKEFVNTRILKRRSDEYRTALHLHVAYLVAPIRPDLVGELRLSNCTNSTGTPDIDEEINSSAQSLNTPEIREQTDKSVTVHE